MGPAGGLDGVPGGAAPSAHGRPGQCWGKKPQETQGRTLLFQGEGLGKACGALGRLCQQWARILPSGGEDGTGVWRHPQRDRLSLGDTAPDSPALIFPNEKNIYIYNK